MLKRVAWRTSAGRIFQKPRKPSRRVSGWLVVFVNAFEQDATAIWRLSCLLLWTTADRVYWTYNLLAVSLNILNTITFDLKTKTKSNKQENIRCWHKKIEIGGPQVPVCFGELFFAQFKFPSCSGSMQHLRHSATHFRFLIRCSRCTPTMNALLFSQRDKMMSVQEMLC